MDALMIGVSGMRGVVGSTLTPEVVSRMSAAFASWLHETQKPASGARFRVVFGRSPTCPPPARRIHSRPL